MLPLIFLFELTRQTFPELIALRSGQLAEAMFLAHVGLLLRIILSKTGDATIGICLNLMSKLRKTFRYERAYPGDFC